jgi:hypothetical protein
MNKIEITNNRFDLFFIKKVATIKRTAIAVDIPKGKKQNNRLIIKISKAAR